MDQRVQASVSKSEDEPSINVLRLPHLVDGARASTGDDQRALAFEINKVLVAMRSPGDEAAGARVLLAALDAHHLDGLVDICGRACRAEAVDTLMTCGFPHALELSPEDLIFARAWRPEANHPGTPHQYFVDGQRYEVDSSFVTGAQIKARIPNFRSDFHLFREGKGGDTARAISDSDSIELDHGAYPGARPDRFCARHVPKDDGNW